MTCTAARLVNDSPDFKCSLEYNMRRSYPRNVLSNLVISRDRLESVTEQTRGIAVKLLLRV